MQIAIILTYINAKGGISKPGKPRILGEVYHVISGRLEINVHIFLFSSKLFKSSTFSAAVSVDWSTGLAQKSDEVKLAEPELIAVVRCTG